MLSIIIPTKNEESVIGGLLSDLKNQTFQNFEVIVADANSSDKTREIVKRFGYQITDGGIPSAGRNLATKLSDYDLLLFFDADVRISKNFLEKAIEEFERDKLDIAGAYFKIFVGSFPAWMNFLGNNFAKFTRQFSKAPVISGDMIMIKKEVFNSLGGFREVEIGEDNDLVVRAVRSGYRFRTLPLSYKSSPRRIDKIGLWRITKVFFLFTYMQITGKVDDEKLQKRIKNIYGELGN